MQIPTIRSGSPIGLLVEPWSQPGPTDNHVYASGAMIETLQDAELAIAKICEWIKRQPTHENPYIDGNCYDDVVIDAVLSWCARLLETSSASLKSGYE